MRASEQESTGSAGLSYVMGDFERIGWGPVPNPHHDLGTDLFIQVRDERRFDCRLVVGAQVKCGPSWFKHSKRSPDGCVEGWWFYEQTADHFDDWVTYGLPHLLVLHSIERRVSYWVHVTADECVSTGEGCKILVPTNQTVDTEHLDALLDVATAQRAASTHERRAFQASARGAPPGRRLRYALLTPRLIAPHGNSGYERMPEPEEYLALIMRRRSFQIANFKEKFPKLLSPSKLKEDPDWRWRFAHWIAQWVKSAQPGGLGDLLCATRNSAYRTAATVVLATQCFESGNYLDAQDLLDDLIEGDDISPVDLGWLLVHRATMRAEFGDLVHARSDAARATQSLRGDEDDPTAALLAAVAANILFVTAGFGSGDLEKVINSNDTAPAWWRAQTLSWALGYLDDRVFDDWVSDARLSIRASDDGWENFEAGRLNALLSSDRQAWRAIVSRQGRYLTRRAHHRRDESELIQGLDLLRRAGDKDSLARSSAVVWQTGPLSALRKVAELVSPRGITQTTASATIKLWGVAADTLSEEYASELASWCIRILSDDDALNTFREKFCLNFRVEIAALETLQELLPVASVNIREQAVRLLLEVPNGSMLAHNWARIALNLNKEVLSSVSTERLRAKALEVEDDFLKDALLRQLACTGDLAAQTLLVERAKDDLRALEFIPDRNRLDEDVARTLIGILTDRIVQVREGASKNRFRFGGVDAARLLSNFNILHPGAADWDALFEFLSDPKVTGEHKERAAELLAFSFDRLDAEVRKGVEQTLPVLLSARFIPLSGFRQHTEAAWHLQVMIEPSTKVQETATAALLSGSTTKRRVAADLLGMGVAPNLTAALHPLLADDNRQVRAAAAFALGRNLGRTRDSNEPLMPAIARVIVDPGALVPSSFLAGISEDPFDGRPQTLDALEGLKAHGSFLVRKLAREFFAKLLTHR